ncbi:reverse transcriptase domain-containing protein [Tanacetum coccineum]
MRIQCGTSLISFQNNKTRFLLAIDAQRSHKSNSRLQKKCKEQSAVRKAGTSGAIAAGSTWPFSDWGIHIIGPLPVAPNGLQFLAIAFEHSTKWIEAKPLTTINGRQVEKFVWEYMVCRFGVPRMINSKEEKHFKEGMFANICKGLKITQSFSPVIEHIEIMHHIGKQLTRSQ